MNDTGAALAGVAADMGARQVQMVAQEIDKEGPVLDLSRDRLAIHCQFECRHVETSPCFLIAPIRSTGLGLCNNDFCRGSHCDAACASRRTPPALPLWPGLPRPSTSLVAAKCKTWMPGTSAGTRSLREAGPILMGCDCAAPPRQRRRRRMYDIQRAPLRAKARG